LEVAGEAYDGWQKRVFSIPQRARSSSDDKENHPGHAVMLKPYSLSIPFFVLLYNKDREKKSNMKRHRKMRKIFKEKKIKKCIHES
jgi:hypothetical protein